MKQKVIWCRILLTIVLYFNCGGKALYLDHCFQKGAFKHFFNMENEKCSFLLVHLAGSFHHGPRWKHCRGTCHAGDHSHRPKWQPAHLQRSTVHRRGARGLTDRYDTLFVVVSWICIEYICICKITFYDLFAWIYLFFFARNLRNI